MSNCVGLTCGPVVGGKSLIYHDFVWRVDKKSGFDNDGLTLGEHVSFSEVPKTGGARIFCIAEAIRLCHTPAETNC